MVTYSVTIPYLQKIEVSLKFPPAQAEDHESRDCVVLKICVTNDVFGSDPNTVITQLSCLHLWETIHHVEVAVEVLESFRFEFTANL